MDEKERIEKNNAIREHGKQTRLRHASMRPVVVEIKLGYENVVDGAARSLLKVASKLERKPEFLAIVSGTAPAPLRREDGVFVLPLTSLRP